VCQRRREERAGDPWNASLFLSAPINSNGAVHASSLPVRTPCRQLRWRTPATASASTYEAHPVGPVSRPARLRSRGHACAHDMATTNRFRFLLFCFYLKRWWSGQAAAIQVVSLSSPRRFNRRSLCTCMYSESICVTTGFASLLAGILARFNRSL
jgi:hypothetical protein